MEFKFIGKTDFNFTHNKSYKMIALLLRTCYIAIFINNSKKLVEILYSDIDKFNDNWVL